MFDGAQNDLPNSVVPIGIQLPLPVNSTPDLVALSISRYHNSSCYLRFLILSAESRPFAFELENFSGCVAFPTASTKLFTFFELLPTSLTCRKRNFFFIIPNKLFLSSAIKLPDRSSPTIQPNSRFFESEKSHSHIPCKLSVRESFVADKFSNDAGQPKSAVCWRAVWVKLRVPTKARTALFGAVNIINHRPVRPFFVSAPRRAGH